MPDDHVPAQPRSDQRRTAPVDDGGRRAVRRPRRLHDPPDAFQGGRGSARLARWLVYGERLRAVGRRDRQSVRDHAAGARQLPVVMVGSHLDSQPNGGRFDGTLGVISACEAVLTVAEQPRRENRLSHCNFQVGTGPMRRAARFQPSLLAAACSPARSISNGRWPAPTAMASPSDRRCGDWQEGAAQFYSRCPDRAAHRGRPCTVCGGRAVRRLLPASGRHQVPARLPRAASPHRAATPMAERRDALLAAAYPDCRPSADIAGMHGLDLHTSVGRLEVYPNSPNTVPAEAVLFIELAALAGDPRRRRATHDRADRGRCPAGRGLPTRCADRPARGRPISPGLVALAEAHRRRTWRDGAPPRYDRRARCGGALRVCPSVVLAVRSQDGVIHHPSEFTTIPTRCWRPSCWRIYSATSPAVGMEAARFQEAAE